MVNRSIPQITSFDVIEDEKDVEAAVRLQFSGIECRAKKLFQRQTEFVKNYFRNSTCGDTMRHVNPFLLNANRLGIITSSDHLPLIVGSFCDSRSKNGISGTAVSISAANGLFGHYKSSGIQFTDLVSDEKCISQIKFGIFHIETVFASIDEIYDDSQYECFNYGIEVPFIVGSYPLQFRNRDVIPMLKIKGFGYRKVKDVFSLIRIDTKIQREYKIPVIEWIMTKDFSKSNNYTFKLCFQANKFSK